MCHLKHAHLVCACLFVLTACQDPPALSETARAPSSELLVVDLDALARATGRLARMEATLAAERETQLAALRERAGALEQALIERSHSMRPARRSRAPGLETFQPAVRCGWVTRS